MKMPAMLKCQGFENSRSHETKPRGSKRQHLDERNNKEGNGLDEDEDEIKGTRYIPSPFIPLPFPQKV